MKTSTLTLRPHVPGAVGTDQEDKLIKGPVAKLVYGGTTLELNLDDVYRLLLAINKSVDSNTICAKDMSILSLGLSELRLEMVADLEHWEQPLPQMWFRDNPNKCSLKHPHSVLNVDCLTSDDKQHIEWDQELKEHTDTKWTTKWGK